MDPPPSFVPPLSQAQLLCDMQAVALSSTTENPALALDCAHNDDENHDGKGWARDVTEKKVMLNPEQEATATMEVRQGDINTDACVMSGEDYIMLFWLFNGL